MKSTFKGNTMVKRITGVQAFGILLAFIVLCVALALASPVFLRVTNIMTVLRQAVVTVIISMGMNFVIGMGGIDLSVGSVVAAAGVVCAALIKAKCNTVTCIAGAIGLALLCGAVNGALIAYLDIVPFIATLATMQIIRGFVYLYTQAIPIYGLRDAAFLQIGQGVIGEYIPIPVLIMLVVVAICVFLMYKTRFGRYVVSIGSSEDVSRLVGINVKKIKMLAYLLCGLMCGIASVVLTARLAAAMHDAGSGYEMDAIAAVVIGGTSMSGGKVSVMGTVIGALLMAVLTNGMTLLSVNTFWHQVVKGMIVLIAVLIDMFHRKSALKSKA